MSHRYAQQNYPHSPMLYMCAVGSNPGVRVCVRECFCTPCPVTPCMLSFCTPTGGYDGKRVGAKGNRSRDDRSSTSSLSSSCPFRRCMRPLVVAPHHHPAPSPAHEGVATAFHFLQSETVSEADRQPARQTLTRVSPCLSSPQKAYSIMTGKGFSFDIPSRTNKNQM